MHGETITLNDSEQKVLGLRWDSMEDELSISFEKVVMLSDSLLPWACCQQSAIY